MAFERYPRLGHLIEFLNTSVKVHHIDNTLHRWEVVCQFWNTTKMIKTNDVELVVALWKGVKEVLKDEQKG